MKNSNFPLPEPDRRLSHNNINNNNSLKDLKTNHNGFISKENSNFSNSNSNFYSNQTESNPFKLRKQRQQQQPKHNNKLRFK